MSLVKVEKHVTVATLVAVVLGAIYLFLFKF